MKGNANAGVRSALQRFVLRFHQIGAEHAGDRQRRREGGAEIVRECGGHLGGLLRELGERFSERGLLDLEVAQAVGRRRAAGDDGSASAAVTCTTPRVARGVDDARPALTSSIASAVAQLMCLRDTSARISVDAAPAITRPLASTATRSASASASSR